MKTIVEIFGVLGIVVCTTLKFDKGVDVCKNLVLMVAPYDMKD
jgi:hypothetical protein